MVKSYMLKIRELICLVVIAFLAVMMVGCKSNEEKVKETVESYLFKNMKNPESLHILSCEVRTDTVPFYLTQELLNLADKYKEALNEYVRYKNLGYLWADEKYAALNKVSKAREEFETAYKIAKDNALSNIETLAYVRSSGTNPLGGVVSSSTIFVIDKNAPTNILGTFTVDTDFMTQFAVIKTIGEGYEFKTNKYGKYETDGLPYLEQFIMRDAE